MADEYGADDDLLAAMAASEPIPAVRRPIQQPTPQRLDKAPPPQTISTNKVVQPTPQVLRQKQTGSTILVSPRQRGNPVLTSIRSMPWEYSDIPADYVLGLTTCALFLRYVSTVFCRYSSALGLTMTNTSLKYHRLHPEYIYTRIRNLQGKYNLRILLTMVDIPNHEDSLRELSKTSMVNNATVILCWSAAECARYIELYKSYENASFAAIRGQQASSYADKLVDFVTVPRSLNKSDAVALVANFGSLKNAVNAEPEQLGMISGWGGIKVKRWSAAVEEPFRAKKAAKRKLHQPAPDVGHDRPVHNERARRLDQALSPSLAPLGDIDLLPSQLQQAGSSSRQFHFLDELDDDDEEEALPTVDVEESANLAQSADRVAVRSDNPQLSGGVAAALAKLRETG